jgi:hypothetical protein
VLFLKINYDAFCPRKFFVPQPSLAAVLFVDLLIIVLGRRVGMSIIFEPKHGRARCLPKEPRRRGG